MKHVGPFFWQVSPRRAALECGLVFACLLIPVLTPVFESLPYPRSLYLVQLPLVCAVVLGLRLRFLGNPSILAVLKECAIALALALGITGVVLGLLAGLGRWDSIRYSYAGTWGTIFFLALSGPEYLGVRVLSGVWQWWNRLRRRRYVWALTHEILGVMAGLGVLVLAGIVFYLGLLFKNDIWGIPPDSPSALVVFWLSIILLIAFALFVMGLLLFLPPAILFSYLVARKMTARLERLALGTQALRQGDLSTRVDIRGEDEVAQLQADFNGMAADLEHSMQALQTEKDKVWALLEARRELVAGISHELRNPVAILQGYSDSLRRGWQERAPQQIEQDLETIQYETARLQTILDDLLTASQIEVGRLRLAVEPVELNPLARRLVETFSKLAWGSKRVQISLAAPEQAVFAQADSLRLEQVMVNLVQNAVRHTSPGGLVVVEIHPGAQEICIEVEDTGEGILPEDLPHIWEKYYQAGSPQRRPAYGTGLGLALVKELTEAMGGRVSVESQPGHGSVFQIHLPACCSPGQSQSEH